MNVLKILSILNKNYPELEMYQVATTPFRTLIATLLSQRARDDQIIPVARELFALADTPNGILKLPLTKLEKTIKPAGKYRQNAKRIRKICQILIKKHNGKVPRSEKELLALPGVGRKTANIVLVHSFGKNAIAVDTHVHRITNRLGWIKTKSPLETEETLKKIVPRYKWRIVNRVFVRLGQTICNPISPFCSKCPISTYCKRVGVTRSR